MRSRDVSGSLGVNMARRYVFGRFLAFIASVINTKFAPITFGRFLAFSTTVENPEFALIRAQSAFIATAIITEFAPIKATLTEGRFTASAS